MVHILMLLWQHSWFQFSSRFESFITICDSIRREHRPISNIHNFLIAQHLPIKVLEADEALKR